MWRINNFPEDKEKKLYIIFLEEKDTYEVIIKPLIDKVSLRLLISLQKLDLRYFNITVFFFFINREKNPIEMSYHEQKCQISTCIATTPATRAYEAYSI